MSHFSVLVIGANIAEQLQPYHEFECTGYNDQYIQNVDQTDEVASKLTGDDPMSLQEALEYYGFEDRIVSEESEALTAGKDAPHMWGYAVVQDGKLVKAVKRTNPNKKWDWFVIGGRWGCMLKLKDGAPGLRNARGASLIEVSGGNADMAAKSSIDIDGMRDAAGRDAAERWDKATAAAAAAGSSWWKSWVQVRAEHGDNREATRAEYNNQLAIKAMKAAVCRHPFHDYDQYQAPREEFIQAARDRALSAYAVLYNGQWAASGEMGRLGMSDDEMAQASWDEKINRFIDELPDDALLTMVDCHI